MDLRIYIRVALMGFVAVQLHACSSDSVLEDPAVAVCERAVLGHIDNGGATFYRMVSAEIVGDAVKLDYQSDSAGDIRHHECRFILQDDEYSLAVHPLLLQQATACVEEQQEAAVWIRSVQERGGDPKLEVAPEMLSRQQACLTTLRASTDAHRVTLATNTLLELDGINGYPYPLPQHLTTLQPSLQD